MRRPFILGHEHALIVSTAMALLLLAVSVMGISGIRQKGNRSDRHERVHNRDRLQLFYTSSLTPMLKEVSRCHTFSSE